jgi:DNA-binding MarR family transcriptional regulator
MSFGGASRTVPPVPDADLVEAVLHASRVLVAVAVRSLAAAHADLTLSQHRALVVLATRGPQRVRDLASLLGVNSSTATRHCDRLESRGLVRRDSPGQDRRAVNVSITTPGRRCVRTVSRARCREIHAILATMSGAERNSLLVALRSFAAAGGEVPEQNWSFGWDETPAAG